jgi:hypothetical protein
LAIIGHADLAKLAVAVKRDIARAPTSTSAPPAHPPRPTAPLRSLPPADHRAATPKLHGDRDSLRILRETL